MLWETPWVGFCTSENGVWSSLANGPSPNKPSSHIPSSTCGTIYLFLSSELQIMPKIETWHNQFRTTMTTFREEKKPQKGKRSLEATRLLQRGQDDRSPRWRKPATGAFLGGYGNLVSSNRRDDAMWVEREGLIPGLESENKYIWMNDPSKSPVLIPVMPKTAERSSHSSSPSDFFTEILPFLYRYRKPLLIPPAHSIQVSKSTSWP